MKILITGAKGMLGSKIASTLSPVHDVISTDLQPNQPDTHLDITSPDQARACLKRHKPDLIIHCAAFTAVDQCESQPEVANAINAAGTHNLVLAAEEVNSAFFYISTDYVFDGTKSSPYLESDPTNPLSIYGSSKLKGEESVRAHSTRWTIARTQWLYGEGGNNFVETMIRLSAERDQIRVVNDQWGAPTYTGDLALQIKVLIEEHKHGLYHISNQGSTSWFTFAKTLLDYPGLPSVQVLPCTTEEFPRPAPRPQFSTLLNDKLGREGLDKMRDWRVALNDYLTARLHQANQ